MSIDARLNKLSPSLLARDRLIRLMNACNKYLPLFITMVEGWAEQMQLRVCWWETMVGYGSALWHLGKFVPKEKRREAEVAVDQYRPFVELPWTTKTHERSWLQISDGMEEQTRQCVAHLWDDLMAIDTVIAEVAAQFGGEDPLRPVMREQLEKARHTLSLLHRFLSGDQAIEITVPSEEALELARTYFDKGLDS